MSEEADGPDGDGPDGDGPEVDGDGEAGCGDEFVVPGPPLPDGGRMCLRHDADCGLRPGVMRPLESGRPLEDNAVLLERREGTPFYNIIGSVADMKKGPSKVVTNAYRRGWDNVFKTNSKGGDA